MFIRGQTEFTSYLEIIKNGIYPVEQFKNIELLTNCQYIESLRLLLRLKRINLWEHRYKYIIVSEDFGCFESARSYRTNIRKDILIVEAYKHNGVFVISTTPSMSFKKYIAWKEKYQSTTVYIKNDYVYINHSHNSVDLYHKGKLVKTIDTKKANMHHANWFAYVEGDKYICVCDWSNVPQILPSSEVPNAELFLKLKKWFKYDYNVYYDDKILLDNHGWGASFHYVANKQIMIALMEKKYMYAWHLDEKATLLLKATWIDDYLFTERELFIIKGKYLYSFDFDTCEVTIKSRNFSLPDDYMFA